MDAPFAGSAVPLPDRRHVLVGGLTLGAAGAVGLVGAAPASASLTRMYDYVDASRRRAGKRRLSRSRALHEVAHAWAKELARSGRLRHNPRYASQIPRGWTRAAENVGYVGGSDRERALHLMWMRSSGHRANILGPYTHIGIGRVIDSRGRLWGVQVFATYPG